MQGLDLFVEIPKGRDGPGASLDLVEEKKRLAGDDAFPVTDLDEGDETLDVKGLFDVLPHLVVRLKVKVFIDSQ